MTADLPPGFGGEPAVQPPAGPWLPTYIGRSSTRSRIWLAAAVAMTAAVAVAALVVALTRKSDPRASIVSVMPTPTAAELAAAQHRLCGAYSIAAKAVQVDTNGSDKAFARIALTNSAVLLYNASQDSALDAEHRSAAQALATAYLIDTAKSSGDAATEAEFRSAVDDVNPKDAAMKKICGGA